MNTEQIRKNRALVEADKSVISQVCQRVLLAAGFEVDIAMNGLIAMQMVNENTYDFCLSDIKIRRLCKYWIKFLFYREAVDEQRRQPNWH
jgi:DNA-binding NtrC family response regulator